MRTLLEHRWAALIGVGAALAAPAVRSRVFPDGSPNLDEVGYLSQAEAIEHGRLTLDAAIHHPSLMPYLSGVHGQAVVFKYQPGWPAALATSHIALGSHVPMLALVAAVFGSAAYWFALEATRRRPIACATAIAASGSPFALLQSATYLAYLPSATVLACAAAAVTRGSRLDRPSWLVTGGGLLGAAFFHRTFDAVLWAAPLLIHVAFSSRREQIALHVRGLVLVGAGAVPGVVAFALYNWHVMGSPLTPAFGASGPNDTFGFGRRASFVVAGRASDVVFTPRASMNASWQYLQSLALFALGGWLFIALAVVGLVVMCRSFSWVPAALALVIPVGYFFWWGVANSVAYGLDRIIGPFYRLPSLIPLCCLAAAAAFDISSRAANRLPSQQARFHLIAGLVVLLAATAVNVPGIGRKARDAGRDRSKVVALQTAPTETASITFVPPEFPGDPYVRTIVPPEPHEARSLVALSPDQAGGRLGLVSQLPGRDLYEVVNHRKLNGIFDPPTPLRRQLALVSGRRLAIRLTAAPQEQWKHASFYLRLDGGEEPLEIALGPRASRSTTLFSLVAPPASSAPDSMVVPRDRTVRYLHAGVTFRNGSRDADGLASYECVWEVQLEGSAESSTLRVVALDPPTTRHLYVFPKAKRWGVEDIAPVLGCSLEPVHR